MENVRSFMDSGILEMYVAGNLPLEDINKVEEMAALFVEVRNEVDAITEALEVYAISTPVVPDPIVKAFLMATIDFTERMKNGEQPTFPPQLQQGTGIGEFSEWLNRPDMVLPKNFEDLHAKIIGYTPKVLTAIVWIKEMTPQEVHDNEFEKFLIVEGTCDLMIEENVYSLVPGDYFAIPLHKAHQVIVTSGFPCKVILQRVAA